ncbi:DUF1178 family protein [Roseateles paludis]|jgi:hypothetical protein|uniref:DUF1178 family protein n=1 Tax=Roseateles paludis TaxID=3145238 RepID=A0ABV0G1P8_9BURK
MKVLDLCCSSGHPFEGWFASESDFQQQNERGLIECPMCGDVTATRRPSAPRLNLSGAREPRDTRESKDNRDARDDEPAASNRPTPAPAIAAELQAAYLGAVRALMARTEDVGPRFAEEARRIHYGETPDRGIRGQVTAEEREALQDEGIETFSLPVPKAMEGPLQ